MLLCPARSSMSLQARAARPPTGSQAPRQMQFCFLCCVRGRPLAMSDRDGKPSWQWPLDTCAVGEVPPEKRQTSHTRLAPTLFLPTVFAARVVEGKWAVSQEAANRCTVEERRRDLQPPYFQRHDTATHQTTLESCPCTWHTAIIAYRSSCCSFSLRTSSSKCAQKF